MKTNEDLQRDVLDAIKWEPLLHAAEIGVTVKDGIVTLTGSVDSYTKKMEVENAAKKVSGVKAVVEKIKLEFSNVGVKTDEEIAAEVLNGIKWNWDVPNNQVKVKVENGWVTLEGEMQWNHQRNAATRAAAYRQGVKGVTNNITIKSDVRDAIEKLDIESALRRSASINDDDIVVTVSGTEVTLTGTVKSWYQRDEAETIAWKAPGTWTVVNNLIVEYDFDLVA
jgi:osmotically-inducible protein OsmY